MKAKLITVFNKLSTLFGTRVSHFPCSPSLEPVTTLVAVEVGPKAGAGEQQLASGASGVQPCGRATVPTCNGAELPAGRGMIYVKMLKTQCWLNLRILIAGLI